MLPTIFAGELSPLPGRRDRSFNAGLPSVPVTPKLLEALGQAIGEEIVYVTGDSRSSTSDLEGQSHAWNAAKIEGKWYLIDPTWNSGYVDRASGFTKFL